MNYTKWNYKGYVHFICYPLNVQGSIFAFILVVIAHIWLPIIYKMTLFSLFI